MKSCLKAWRDSQRIKPGFFCVCMVFSFSHNRFNSPEATPFCLAVNMFNKFNVSHLLEGAGWMAAGTSVVMHMRLRCC